LTNYFIIVIPDYENFDSIKKNRNNEESFLEFPRLEQTRQYQKTMIQNYYHQMEHNFISDSNAKKILMCLHHLSNLIFLRNFEKKMFYICDRIRQLSDHISKTISFYLLTLLCKKTGENVFSLSPEEY
jgi:hypothetical protein